MIHPQHARTVRNLMQALNPNQAGDATRVEHVPDVVGRPRKAQAARIFLDQGMDEVDLLEGLDDDLGAGLGPFCLGFGTAGDSPSIHIDHESPRECVAERDAKPRNKGAPELSSDTTGAQPGKVRLPKGQMIEIQPVLLDLVLAETPDDEREIIMAV
jgi:hypothetical protein